MTRGVKFGRPPKLNAEQITLIARLVDEGQTAPQIAETFGVHETTIYRCLGEPDPYGVSALPGHRYPTS